jgi:hypothetical protein
MAKPSSRMPVVPRSGLLGLGGSTSATVGDSSRLLRSLMMLSTGLGRRLNAMFSARQID